MAHPRSHEPTTKLRQQTNGYNRGGTRNVGADHLVRNRRVDFPDYLLSPISFATIGSIDSAQIL